MTQKYYKSNTRSVFNSIRRLQLILLTTVLFLQLKSQPRDNDIVYASPFVLTNTMMKQHAQFVQQLLDITYTQQQKEKHYQLIKDYWIKNDYQGMQAIQNNLEFAKQLNTLPATELKATILQLRSSLILSFIEDGKNAEDSRWYYENYLSAHPPLVQGEIPFIRETADALIDGEQFINKELKSKNTLPVTQQQRDAAYLELATHWKTFGTQQKKAIMEGASKMALIFYRWGKMSTMEKIHIKLQYVGEQYLTAEEKKLLQHVAVNPNFHNGSQHWGFIQSELNYMKQSTDIIMGHGIRWDPSRNRYVQDGGIVTEFW